MVLGQMTKSLGNVSMLGAKEVETFLRTLNKFSFLFFVQFHIKVRYAAFFKKYRSGIFPGFYDHL